MEPGRIYRAFRVVCVDCERVETVLKETQIRPITKTEAMKHLRSLGWKTSYGLWVCPGCAKK